MFSLVASESACQTASIHQQSQVVPVQSKVENFPSVPINKMTWSGHGREMSQNLAMFQKSELICSKWKFGRVIKNTLWSCSDLLKGFDRPHQMSWFAFCNVALGQETLKKWSKPIKWSTRQVRNNYHLESLFPQTSNRVIYKFVLIRVVPIMINIYFEWSPPCRCRHVHWISTWYSYIKVTTTLFGFWGMQKKHKSTETVNLFPGFRGDFRKLFLEPTTQMEKLPLSLSQHSQSLWDSEPRGHTLSFESWAGGSDQGMKCKHQLPRKHQLTSK